MRRCAVPRRALSSAAPSAPKPRVLLLAGPTGVGKSRLAVELARRLKGEIVSADSAAIYRGLDVGTAKPDVNMLSAVPHHLLDVANVNEAFSVMQWANAAHQITEDILRRGKVPIVVGGSGLYFHWYLYGGSQSPPQKVHPEDSEEHVRMHYAAALTRLRQASPEYAESIVGVNVRRLSRALQKVRAGIPLKLLRNVKMEEREQVLPYEVRGVFLTQPRVELLPLLDYRCEKIVHAGLIEETANLILKRGMRPGTQPALAIGYRQVIEYFQEGNYTATTFRNFVARYQSMTRNLVRKQETWFKKSPRYKWLFKPASETTLADVVARLYTCPQADYDAFPHTAPRELTPQESETLRQYSSQLCMWSFGASAKQARSVEALARRVHPILASYVPPPHAYGSPDQDEA